MQIIQIHQQPINVDKEKETVFYAQRGINSHEEFMNFFKDTQEKFPLQDGMQWLFVLEGSKYFMGTLKEE